MTSAALPLPRVAAPPVSTWIARRILHAVAGRVPVDLRLPDGRLLGGRRAASARGSESAGGPRPVLEIHDPEAVYRRVAAHPKIGIGESYMAGEWDVAPGTDLAGALRPFAERMTTAVPAALARLRRLVDRPIPLLQRNSVSGSRRNIAAHYDLSNALFEAFLDPTMSYSSALFDSGRPLAGQSLHRAQERKMDAILDLAGVGDGTRLLEIGTGWGALALRAARRGARVTTITLSAEQASAARHRIEQAGLAHRVEIELRDYREIEGRTFDAVVSVEMIEAVGEEFWPRYFQVVDRVLAPGGVAAIQTILMPHERYLATRHSYGWIQKHIFPGGLIPSERAIAEITSGRTESTITHTRRFGPHYAETLRRWRGRFIDQWPLIASTGFDETFRRMWEFYLAYCEAGFASGYLDVAQIRLAKGTAL